MMSQTPIEFRKGRPEDAPRISALLRATAGNCVVESEDWIRAHASRFRVAVEDGCDLVASAALLPTTDGDALLLRSVAVAREHRGRGLARRLLEPLFDDVLTRSVDVWCRTTEPGFFERYGFRRVGRSPGFDGRDRFQMKRFAGSAGVTNTPHEPFPSPVVQTTENGDPSYVR